MKPEDLAICRKRGWSPDDTRAEAQVAHYRAFCAAVGIDPDAPEPDPTEERLYDIEWRLSACDPDRTCNTYAMLARFHEGGEPAVEAFIAELDQQRAQLFAEYEAITGHGHPDAASWAEPTATHNAPPDRDPEQR